MPSSQLRIAPLLGLLLLVGAGCQPGEAPSKSSQDAPETDTAAKSAPVAGGMVTAQSLVAGKTGRGNRLLHETSPYLLLHAHNPVEWFPWGEEAFAKAKAENKLVFLSIGYSSCYWCHVMERETFLDQEVAEFLNAHFVAIKVDREERPDVDEIYITAMRALGGQTGWPLTVFLLPDGRPIPAGGTYFPPRDRDGRPGFLTLIQAIDKAWREDPERFRSDAEKVTDAVRTALRNRAGRLGAKPGAEMITAVQDALATAFDPEYGGFGFAPDEPRRPKFPEPPNLLFLIDRLRRGAGDEVRALLTTTLDRMAAGGIRDHVGGGFHRYSTDRFWRIPHFEKMLYDNGQLATVYAEAFALTKRPEYRRVVVELLEFVERELTTPQGAFFTALDAESEAEEGRYYAWDTDELRRVLGADFALLEQAYGVGAEPNFVAPHGEGKARHVLLTGDAPEKLAERFNTTEAELANRWAPIREKLSRARGGRPRPLTDTKVLVSWNGLMIRGYADAGRLLGEAKYTAAAAKAADYLLANVRAADGRLFRTIHEGKPRLNAFLDDYAYFIDGLIALHRATNEPRWLDAAEKLQRKQDELFWDQELDGYFLTASDHESLIARSKQAADNVLPSANAVSAGNLLYLARALDKAEHRQRADQTIWSFARLAAEFPGEMPRMAMAVAELLEVAPSK